MKKVILALLLILVFDDSFLAQHKSNNGFLGSIGLNFSFPLAKKQFPPNADLMGATFYLAGGYLMNNNMALRSEINYTSFQDYFAKSDGSKLTGSFNSFAIKGELLAGTFKKNAFLDVYGITGAGYYSFSQGKDGDINLDKDEGNFGAVIGAGINYRLYKSLSISWEAEYNAVINNSSLSGYLNLSTLNLSFVP
jgi:hypothetical protein